MATNETVDPRDATLWKIVAEFTRENAQRDITAIELKGQIDYLVKEFTRLDAESKERSKPLNDEQARLLERLQTIVVKRDNLDLLNEKEMQALRLVLQSYTSQQKRVAQLEQRVDEQARELQAVKKGILAPEIQDRVTRLLTDWEQFVSDWLTEIKAVVVGYRAKKGVAQTRSEWWREKLIEWAIAIVVIGPISALILILVQKVVG